MSTKTHILTFDVCLTRQHCNVAHTRSVGMLQCNKLQKTDERHAASRQPSFHANASGVASRQRKRLGRLAIAMATWARRCSHTNRAERATEEVKFESDGYCASRLFP
jgi:hypothetical protein